MNKKKSSSLIIINKVITFIRKNNLNLQNQNILICLSGGQDSLCLLIIILQFINQLVCFVGCIYLVHFWNVENIYKLSLILKLGFVLKKPLYFVLDTQLNFTEQKARVYRYDKSYRIGIFYNYNTLLTGHTSTDQIETLLLNLFRGSSKQGLTSLSINQVLESKNIKNLFLSKNDLI